MNAFERTAQLYGSDALERFTALRVGVFGLGGVGSMAAEALVRSGVGRFVLVDFDRLRPTNLNRQVIALHSTMGRHKAEVLRERMLDINPQVSVEAHMEFIDLHTRGALLDRIDVLVDAIDALNPKVGLLEEVVQRGLPLISVMGAAGRRDPSKIRLDDISRSEGCPLARRVRKMLRRRGIDGGFPVVFSTEQAVPPLAPGDDVSEEKEMERGRERGVQPSAMAIPAIMGLWAATWVLGWAAENA